MSAPTIQEEIQFLIRAREIRREAATSGVQTEAAIALATLRLAIAAERIADALEVIAARPGGMG